MFSDISIGKLRIDLFYIVLFAVTALLYGILEGRCDDIACMGAIFVVMCALDCLINFVEDKEKKDERLGED